MHGAHISRGRIRGCYTIPMSSAEEAADAFLGANLKFASTGDRKRPHVTLTFAQSQDGKIAGPGKKQLALSGSESMLMTHKLRTLHDGILVGIGTVLNDDPQLNARLLAHPPAVQELPRPIVLDSKLRMPVDCKLLRNYSVGVGRQPLVLCSSQASSLEQRNQLEKAGAQVISIDRGSSADLLDWKLLLQHIHESGVQRLMVEGGAAVIDSLMQRPQHIDALLVTIAPVMVGPEGFGYLSALPDATAATTEWDHPRKAMFQMDEVVLWHRC